MNRLLDISKSFINSKSNDIQTFSEALSKGTIDAQLFAKLVYGPNFQSRLYALDLIKSHPQIYEHYHLTQACRPQQREKSAQIMFKTHKLLNLTYEEYIKDPNKLSLICSAVVNYDYGYSVKSGVHFFLYTRTLVNLGTQKHEKFVQRAMKYQDIGGFALTQLTHGSNVKGIQTQAHYDHSTQSYVLHTPTKDGMKFWIGAVGNAANMVVVWANLILDSKNYGIHAFVTPIRDSNTHKIFSGVIVGDCGPKTGLNAIDNGFIMFDNYRIPRQNQLDKISGVDANGKFFSIVEGEQKRFGLHLAALSGGRFMVSMNSGVLSLNSLAIAIRYTCVRKQFSKNPKIKVEQDLIINYPLTKRRMMPLLAQSVVYNTGNFFILKKWDQNFANILNPKNLVIQQLHFISSALKPKSSWFANQCVRQSRQMMGGHGYSSYSKMGVLINDNQINTTWQGDNNVLLQQTTKICLENMQRVMKGKQIQINILKFLQNPPSFQTVEFSENNLTSLQWAKRYLQFRISEKLQEMGMKMMALKQQNTPLFDIWNKIQPFLGKTIGLMLGDLYYLETMIIRIQQANHPQTKNTFTNIALLWILKVFKDDEYVDDTNHGLIQTLMMDLSQKLAKQSLLILQAIAADDQVIGSPFADQKGNGMKKYMEKIFEINSKYQKPSWYSVLTNREQNKN